MWQETSLVADRHPIILPQLGYKLLGMESLLMFFLSPVHLALCLEMNQGLEMFHGCSIDGTGHRQQTLLPPLGPQRVNTVVSGAMGG